MTDRQDRHAFLKALVRERTITDQSELLEALAAEGWELHQSTLSRDLKALGIRKVEGRYTVVAPAAPPLSDTKVPLPSVHSFVACGPNLITARTGAGQAQILGVLLDSIEDSEIAGTIAGDDTVLIMTQSRAHQRAALALLRDWFGEERHVRG